MMMPLTLSANNYGGSKSYMPLRRDVFSPISVQVINSAMILYMTTGEITYSGVDKQVVETPIEKPVKTPVDKATNRDSDNHPPFTRDDFVKALTKVSTPNQVPPDEERSKTSG